MPRPKVTNDSAREVWRRTARSRLRLELAGLAFACQHGFRPEDYAHHLWGKGAVGWMKKARPGAAEYLRKEARAFGQFYPAVSFTIVAAGDDRAELIFSKGCLGGWGHDPWALARSLGLTQRDVCAYCRESFRVWAEQLGLSVHIGPEKDRSCRLCVTQP